MAVYKQPAVNYIKKVAIAVMKIAFIEELEV